MFLLRDGSKNIFKMKKLLIFSFSIFLFWGALAQNVSFTNDLKVLINSSDQENNFIRINIILREKANISELKSNFFRKSIPINIRAKKVLSILTKTAENTQSDIIKDIITFDKEFSDSYINLEQFWIVNMIVVSAKPSLIHHLSKRKDIELIELTNSRLVYPIKPLKSDKTTVKSPGGIEPGLIAINAPALWKMGYTGRGRISYSIDTGVWPEHPAIGERFLAHYFPISQCFYPYDSEIPIDKPGSHGTHTLGTTLGLEKETNDTIGVAFNAYWIVSDPVATSMATVKPLSDFMYAFQWALNPDGDTATTFDIPDAINNSWGYTSPGDTALCDSYVSDVFTALEAAGIANIFSAGNDGPAPNTISEPHHINTGLVNSFTVGSISPHDTTYQISGFSSRGPTNCPGSGSLKIKPEVVAPGQDIRSASLHSGYGVKSGTSMAAPHTTGAVLLLKEAFPFLPGEEILLALYYSAKDLGDASEDNTYGTGLIDVLGAFNYLLQFYTPIAPVSNDFDIAINKITYPNTTYICDPKTSPQIEIINYGDNNITTAKFEYWFNGEDTLSWDWSGNLASMQSETITLPEISTMQYGDRELIIKVMLDESITEFDEINNRRVARFNIRRKIEIPFFEDFESYSLQNSPWLILNPDNKRTWDTISTGGLENSSLSVFMEFFANPFGKGVIDEMISPVLKIADTGKIILSFDMAYQLSHPQFADTLKIFASTDCGLSFPYLLYEKGGADLTTNDTLFEKFIPSDSSHWRKEKIDMSEFTGQGGILIKFQGINEIGNNLFIDNILLNFENAPFSIPELENHKIIFYPNPANSYIFIEYSDYQNESNIEINVFDILGNCIINDKLQAGKSFHKINISYLKKGLYIIKLKYSNDTKHFKFMKN